MSTKDTVRNRWLMTVKDYYHFIDQKNLNSLYELFSLDIEYLRLGTPPILGLRALKKFYEVDRIIDSGQHTKLVFEIKRKSLHTSGVFIGLLKNAEAVTVSFKEIFYFDTNGKIVKRVTRFPKGQKNI